MREMDKKYVRMIPGILQMEMDTDMNLFDVVNWSLDYTDNTTETVEMELILKRKIKSELLTTFLPTILLTMITFATSFFKPFFFEAALSVNLTTMLVMTTIFISKMESLPPSSDTKMIDYWLILCQLVPFAQVVLLTAMEYLREEELEKEEDKEETEETISEEESGPETIEAWKLPQEKNTKVNYVPMLIVIGKLLFKIQRCINGGIYCLLI